MEPMKARRKSVRDFFSIELPIIQAPMAGVQTSPLAIAVSEAGGLGSLPCALLSRDQVRVELSSIRAKTTKPYNVNFFCHTPPDPDPLQEEKWRATLQPYYEELGIDPSTIPHGPGRAPFTSSDADLIEEFRPPVVSFHFGLPSPELVTRVRSTGAAVISSATTVDEALWLEANGADAIIAQGLEAGGHRGMFLTDDISTQVGTFALLPQIVNAVNIPVIAAGGIAGPEGVAAALRLGAAGVQAGTAFLTCPEATTSQVHRAALQSSLAQHTTVTRLFSGRPARGIVNRIIRELGAMNPIAPAFPLATAALAPLRAKAESLGDGGFSPLWCGQNATGCAGMPAASLTRFLAEAKH